MAVKMSQLLGNLSKSDVDNVQDLLEKSNLPISIKSKISASKILSAMSVDKKVINGNIRLILMKKLGISYIDDTYKKELLDKVIKDFCKL
jgi:3-dehydroquinate synthase